MTTQYESGHLIRRWRIWLPTPGNIIFSVILVVGLLWAQNAGALTIAAPAPAATTIPYQGQLSDTNGAPLNGSLDMTFRLYDGLTGGNLLWQEERPGLAVNQGLFNVLLGSVNPIAQNLIANANPLYLELEVNHDGPMAPRIAVGAVPYAMQALTVPDGSVTRAKLAPDVQLEPLDNSITNAKLADNAVGAAELQNGAVTQAKLGADVSLDPGPNSVTTAELADSAVTTGDITNGAVTLAKLDPTLQLGVPSGTIVMWSGALATIPAGWVLCDGANGTPDLRDRFILGVDAGQNPGETGGAHTRTLTVDNLPAHTHTFTTDPGGAHTHNTHIVDDNGFEDGNNKGGVDDTSGAGMTTTTDGSHTHTGTTNTTGNGQAFDVRPKYYRLAFIMKL